jgi:hypothetical protein
VDYNTPSNETRTDAEQSETGGEFRVIHESEEWRSIEGFDGIYVGVYEVSNLGRVRSLHSRHKTPKILKPRLDMDGYPEVCLCVNSKPCNRGVHRLVARAFHGDKKNALHREVSHLDGTRTNNRADNLKWVSHAENMAHKRLHGTNPAGERHPGAKLTDDGVRRIYALYVEGWSRSKIAARFGVSPATIDDLVRGTRWRHIPRPAGFAERRRSCGMGGAFNPSAKLTWEEAEEIRARRRAGESSDMLAKAYGLGRATVFKLVAGDTYRRKNND